MGRFQKRLLEAEQYFTNHIGERDSFTVPDGPIIEPKPEDVVWVGTDKDNEFIPYLFKGLNFDTKEGVIKACYKWYTKEFSDFVFDLKHDGDYVASQKAQRALNTLKKACLDGIKKFGIKKEDGEGIDYILPKDYDLKQQCLQTTNSELKALMDEDGNLKSRASWGVIKEYNGTDEGKLFKKLWASQFANKGKWAR